MGKFLQTILKNPPSLKFILTTILITCFLSYGLTADMYFWKDDFALMIKAQHPEESVGFFGPGLKGEGAYGYITIPFALLYPYFGLNAWQYFLVGIILYFFASIGVFVLALEVFENRTKALLAALIFSSGFIGADSIYGLTNSYQTSWTILLLAICLKLLLKSFREGNLGYYVISIFTFVLSLETGYIRAHGFFLVVLSSIFLLLDRPSLKRIIMFVMGMTPFYFIFKYFYLNSTSAGVGSSQLLKSLQVGNYDYFYNPLITFINIFIPTSTIKWSLDWIKHLYGRDISIVKYQLLLLAIFTILLFILFGYLLIKKKFTNNYPENRKYILILVFSLALIVGSFIGVFYIGAASTYLESTHRYLSTAFVGVSFFWVSLFSLKLDNSKKPLIRYYPLIPVLVICFIYLVLVNLYSIETINLRTEPQKEFFSQLKREVPIIKKKTFLYFDVSNKNNTNGKFGNIFGAGSVGGSAEITMHYPGVDRYDVITTINDFSGFISTLDKEKGDINETYYFYFQDNKLINRTSEFRAILEKGKRVANIFPEKIVHETNLVKSEGKYKLENTSFEIDFPDSISSITDGILKFNLEIIPNNDSYKAVGQIGNPDDLYLEYLLSKSKIKKSSKIEALNYFQNQTPENLLDSKPETSWMADRGLWHNLTHGIDKSIQFLEISLPSPINLGGILFTNGHNLRTPTVYQVMVNKNNAWQEIKSISYKNAKATNEVWFDKLGPAITDKVRIEIINSSSGDAPQLAEIELVEDKYSNLDFKKALEIEQDPTILLNKNPESSLVKNYFAQNGKLSFYYLSNKDNDYNLPKINFNIQGFDNSYGYQIPIAANGTNLLKAKFFNLNYPAKYIFSNFEYISPSVSQQLAWKEKYVDN